GLMFGWNALAIMLKDTNNFTKGCDQGSKAVDINGNDYICESQESKLAVLWTLGIFALNFGPVLVGFLLDWAGPKLTAMTGVLLNILGLVLLGLSNSHDFNALHAARPHILSLRGRLHRLWHHLLDPEPNLQRHGKDKGCIPRRHIGYAIFCSLWLVTNLWMMPWHSLKTGQVYVYASGRFKQLARRELEHSRSIQLPIKDSGAGTAVALEAVPGSPPIANGHSHHNESHAEHPVESHTGLRAPGMSDSADTRWLSTNEAASDAAISSSSAVNPSHMNGSPAALRSRGTPTIMGSSSGAMMSSGAAAFNGPAVGAVPLGHGWGGRGSKGNTPRDGHVDPEAPLDVIWGPLVFEARRFVELRQKSFWQQFLSSESFGMGVFYTLNVFCIQFYLGTTRLQLEHKGDYNHHYTTFANIMVSFGGLGIPIIGWLLDKKGYGITLGTINAMGVIASACQAIPSLRFQVVTLIIWLLGRFFLYSSYYAIFGALFGFRNFGKMVAVDNTFNGLVGLLQLPLTDWGLQGLRGNFLAINLIQVGLLLPQFIFCWFMYHWERQELVPIRPSEGEELPCNMVGPRMKREGRFLDTLQERFKSGAEA
ncbi:hypothetical protein WJX74_009705, partial [Apatococcus lobatus]